MTGLLFVTTCLAVAYVSNAQSTKSSLANELLEEYNKTVPHDGSKTMTHNLNILQISLCPKMQRLTINGYLQMSWKDDRLTWDAAEWGIDKLWIPYNEINLPDVTLLNGASQIKMEHPCPFNLALVYPNGTIVWTPSVSFSTICDVNYVNYPWGQQSCSVQFGSQTRDIEAGRPEVGPDTENLQSNMFEVMSKTVEEVEKPLPCCPEITQKSLEYKMVFKKKADFHKGRLRTQGEKRRHRRRNGGCNQDFHENVENYDDASSSEEDYDDNDVN